MNGGNSVSSMLLSIVEGIASNTFGRVPSDEFDGLYNTVDNLIYDQNKLSDLVLIVNVSNNIPRAQYPSTLPQCSHG